MPHVSGINMIILFNTTLFRTTPSGSVPVAGPLEAMHVSLLQLPLPNIPERGGDIHMEKMDGPEGGREEATPSSGSGQAVATS